MTDVTVGELSEGDLVFLDWRDSTSLGDGWQSVENVVHSATQLLDEGAERHEQTAGFFLHANDGYVVVAHNYTPASRSTLASVNGVMAIPHEAIRRLRRLVFEP